MAAVRKTSRQQGVTFREESFSNRDAPAGLGGTEGKKPSEREGSGGNAKIM